uniref:hypothetical protein n=1 Tax=Fulvivirga sp. TaxID=1931237 RepID=UPI00404B98F5
MQKLIETNDQFNKIMLQLYLQGSICRNDYRLAQLSTEAKYCIIRMKSSQFLAFDGERISLSASGATYLLQILSENGMIRLSA